MNNAMTEYHKRRCTEQKVLNDVLVRALEKLSQRNCYDPQGAATEALEKYDALVAEHDAAYRAEMEVDHGS